MADNPRCRCVFPSPTEQELVTIPGEQPGTAMRVQVEGGRDGYVRLEQLAHDERLGWYVQKSFIVPGEALAALIPQLRKADCLIAPHRRRQVHSAQHAFSAPKLRLSPPAAAAEHVVPERRQA